MTQTQVDARPWMQQVTVFWGGGLVQALGRWDSKYKRLHWWAPRGTEPTDLTTGRPKYREPFELNVETPGYERGRIWAWGWDGAEARALKTTLALERT